MAPSSPSERLSQIKNALVVKDGDLPIAFKFRPKLPVALISTQICHGSFPVYPTRTALVHLEAGKKWSFSEWAMRVCYLAYGLKGMFIKPGDRVAVLAPNTPMIADLIQACPAVKAVIVTINIRLTRPEILYIIEHSGASVVFADHQFVDLTQGCSIPVVVSYDGAKPPAQDPFEQVIERGKKSASEGWDGLELEADENAPYAISYTSGTTGKPKGVVTTLRSTYLAALANVIESRLTADSCFLWIVPMFHCVGWTFPFACTAAHATQFCLRSVGTYDLIWDHILHHKITHYCGAPTVQLMLYSHKKARRVPQPVTALVAGAAPTPTQIKSLESLGIEVVHVYGLTETLGPSTRAFPQDWWEEVSEDERYHLKAQQGHSYLTTDDVRVIKLAEHRDEANPIQETAADGHEVGEIVMRGNLTMKEYYNDLAATQASCSNGWFHTGDLAVRFADGRFAIMDRAKDIIISGGENASSLMIEEQLSAHPDVQECAVVAKKEAKYGERPFAFVVLTPTAASKWHNNSEGFAQALKDFSRSRLPGFARPEWVQVVPEIEKSATGKVLKYELRKRVNGK
ncbi:acetyl-CoA synthetase-like protein [Atractiella rhizophila]|nr:acetyl-CoA synthetase-like protein [Atractiella rhizophila]